MGCPWREEPSPDYLAALDAERDELPFYSQVFDFAGEQGLAPLYSAVASEDEWDEYEWRWSLNGERYAAQHVEEPEAAGLLDWIRRGRDRHLRRGGRETLGFGLFLFREEEALSGPPCSSAGTTGRGRRGEKSCPTRIRTSTN
jgi:hypothetical protein